MTTIERLIVVACFAMGGAGCDSFGLNEKDDAEEAQLEASREISEQQHLADTKRAEIDSELGQGSQQKVDSLNAEIDEAKVKAQQAKATVRDDFNAGIAAVESNRDQIAKDISAAGTRGEAAAQKLKDDFDTRIDGLKTRVDVLSKQL